MSMSTSMSASCPPAFVLPFPFVTVDPADCGPGHPLTEGTIVDSLMLSAAVPGVVIVMVVAMIDGSMMLASSEIDDDIIVTSVSISSGLD